MKNYLFLILLVVCCFHGGLGQAVGNPDDTAKIERPCPSFDVNCLRKYFVKHGACKKQVGHVPDPLLRPQNTIYIPRVNLTITLLDEVVRGLNGRIEEFYINRDTDRLVLAVEFRNLSTFSDLSFFRFHRPRREPVVTVGSYKVSFKSVVVTAVIPKVDDIKIRRAECTAFVNDATAPFEFGQSVSNSKDSQVERTLADFYTNIPVNIQEIFLTDASFYITSYIQFKICDFGLHLL